MTALKTNYMLPIPFYSDAALFAQLKGREERQFATTSTLFNENIDYTLFNNRPYFIAGIQRMKYSFSKNIQNQDIIPESYTNCTIYSAELLSSSAIQEENYYPLLESDDYIMKPIPVNEFHIKIKVTKIEEGSPCIAPLDTSDWNDY